MNTVKNRLVDIAAQVLNINDPAVFQDDRNLRELGLNSITFVQMIVMIENEFGFEFRDDDLNLSAVETFGELENMVMNYLR